VVHITKNKECEKGENNKIKVKKEKETVKERKEQIN
jgi:hypothetical protein